LADFDLDMRQTAPLSMTWDRIVGFVTDEVRLVVPDDEIGLIAQQVQHHPRETAITVVQDRRVHLATDPIEYIRHAVLGNQNCGASRRGALVEQRANVIVVRVENLSATREPLLFDQPEVAGNLARLAHHRNRSGYARVAITVDDQARIVLCHQRRIKRFGYLPRHAQGADIPGYVPLQFRRWQAQAAQRPRNPGAGVVNNNDEVRSPLAPLRQEGRRFIHGDYSVGLANRAFASDRVRFSILRHSGDRLQPHQGRANFRLRLF
jgi:hypothetical protein